MTRWRATCRAQSIIPCRIISVTTVFLPAAEIRQGFLSELGEYRPEQTVQMCGSGVTACHNVLAMAYAGLEGARLYAGSWSEWIRDTARPVAREIGGVHAEVRAE